MDKAKKKKQRNAKIYAFFQEPKIEIVKPQDWTYNKKMIASILGVAVYDEIKKRSKKKLDRK